MVQGRLTKSPPGVYSGFQRIIEDEFAIASNLGFSYIELIAEVQHNLGNPLMDNGIEEIKISKR